jgi:signal recognition particle receptor subunit beta
MAELSADARAVNARILYWGPPGSGKTTNLEVIHAKLRPDHRGELEVVGTALDPTVSYEVIPIELGDLSGYRTRIQVVSVPGDRQHALTRKQLLDEVDGIVFVADAQRNGLDDNVASFEELRASLGAYGRSLEEVPLVIQYNKCDLADAYTLEELHRKLEMRGAAAFEAVATEGTGVLPTLTTISKRVIRAFRERRPADAAVPSAEVEDGPPSLGEEPIELRAEVLASADEAPGATAGALAAAAEALLEPSLDPLELEVPATPLVGGEVTLGTLSIERIGDSERISPAAVRIPLVLRDESGTTHVLHVTLSLGGSG